MKRGTKVILGLTAVATAACTVGALNKRRKKYGTRLIDEALNMFCKPCNKYAEDDFEDDDFEDEDDDLIFDDSDLFVEPGETQTDAAETESDTAEAESDTAEAE